MDVKVLYTNILNNEGIAAVKRRDDNYSKKTVATKVITTLLALNLTLNNFIFNSVLPLNQSLCYGNNMHPSYANIFMSEVEERYIYLFIKNPTLSALYQR